jgi:hypothetical protein
MHWSAEEHQVYLECRSRGLSWQEMAQMVGTRTVIQCISHHQKMKKRTDRLEQDAYAMLTTFSATSTSSHL